MTIHTISLLGGALDGDKTKTPDLPYVPETVTVLGNVYRNTGKKNNLGQPIFMLESLNLPE